MVQRGLVDGGSPSRFYAFPSIAVNKNDDVLLGFSSFADSEFASAQYTFRLATDPPNSMQTPNVLQAGKDCYDKDFTTGRVRWGDYSATVVDPTDDTKMWTVQEYAEMAVGPARDDSRWGTWWGMLDPTPAITITDGFVVEGDSGTTPATFDLTLSVPTSQAVTVTWATADGSATTGDNDYVGASGTVVFAPGETAKTVTVAVKGDIKKEGLETFVVNFALGAPVNATLPDTQAVGSIGNDDPDPQISISDKQVFEGSPSGTTPAVFLVTLSNPSSSTVTVNFNAAPGTASIGSVSPDDLNPAGGTLTFNPGVVELPVTVNVLRDTNVEGNETFFVNLSSPLPAGVTILKGTGNGVILNDDPTPTFPGVAFLTVVSDGGSSANSGRNRLEWLNPVDDHRDPGSASSRTESTLPTACTYPANEGDGSGVANLAFGGSGTTQSYSDTGLDLGDAYCYSVFVEYPVLQLLERRQRPGAAVQRGVRQDALEVLHRSRRDDRGAAHGRAGRRPRSLERQFRARHDARRGPGAPGPPPGSRSTSARRRSRAPRSSRSPGARAPSTRRSTAGSTRSTRRRARSCGRRRSGRRRGRPPLASSSPTAAPGTTSSWGRARPRTTASTPSTPATGR